MITQRKVMIPIFDYKLTIVIYDDGPEPRAVTRHTYGAALVAINSKHGSSIVHEAEHVKNLIWDYIGYIPQSATYADVYVALNAQYHDYCELLKAWFGDNIDTKVVESAINFWFKDGDYKSGGSKVYKYFREA